MLEYLSRAKLIEPSACDRRGRGCTRNYSFGDVVMLRAVAKLLQHGISVSRLKSSLRRLRAVHPEITPNSIPASFLVTDGRKLYFRESESALLDLSKGQLSFAFVIELNSIQKEVKQRMGEPLRPVRKRAG